MSSHNLCENGGRHVCQRPSGRTCVEDGCDQEAGTLWGPYWCPEHDKERLDRVSSSLDKIMDDLRKGADNG
jgi:hypothetical protein